VIGALFKREFEQAGPKFQISSDASEALGILAGQPVQLNVTALRKEEVPTVPVDQTSVDLNEALAPETLAPVAIDPIESAAAAIETASITPTPRPAPAAAPAKTSDLTKPFIQVGIFSVKANADRNANTLRDAGVTPTVKEQTSKGKTFWRVIVGPTQTSAERSKILATIKSVGFTDAYPVTN
jgi:cell division septation protein DedD